MSLRMTAAPLNRSSIFAILNQHRRDILLEAKFNVKQRKKNFQPELSSIFSENQSFSQFFIKIAVQGTSGEVPAQNSVINLKFLINYSWTSSVVEQSCQLRKFSLKNQIKKFLLNEKKNLNVKWNCEKSFPAECRRVSASRHSGMQFSTTVNGSCREVKGNFRCSSKYFQFQVMSGAWQKNGCQPCQPLNEWKPEHCHNSPFERLLLFSNYSQEIFFRLHEYVQVPDNL